MAILPLLGVLVYSNYERQRQDLESGRADALILLKGIAHEHENIVAVTRKFLTTLAKLPIVKQRDATACEKLFRELLKENAQYVTIFAADSEGMIFANALPSGKFSIKEREYFQNMLKKKNFPQGAILSGRFPASQACPLPFRCWIPQAR